MPKKPMGSNTTKLWSICESIHTQWKNIKLLKSYSIKAATLTSPTPKTPTTPKPIFLPTAAPVLNGLEELPEPPELLIVLVAGPPPAVVPAGVDTPVVDVVIAARLDVAIAGTELAEEVPVVKSNEDSCEEDGVLTRGGSKGKVA